MTAVSLVAQPIWGDQSWLLYAAGQVLDGARIGTDIVETNPPTIIWLSEIPMALSCLLDMPPDTAMKMCLGLLVLLSAAWSGSLVRRIPRAGSGPMAIWVAMGIAYATTVYSWTDVGQREYIMVLLVLPYLITAAIRLDGVSPLRWQGIAAGVAALVGFSMKPQHLVVIAGVEFLLACRGGWRRSFLRPEVAGAVLAGLAYIAVIAIFAPDYVTKVVPLAYRAYLGYQNAPILALIEPRRTAKIAALLLLWAIIRRRLEYRALCDVFTIAAVGSTIAYLIQHKGWQYQFLPADAFFILLLAVMLAEGFIRWTAPLQVPRLGARMASLTALVSCLVVGFLYYPLHSAKAAADVDINRVAAQEAILAALPTGTTIAVLGPNYASIFDYVLKYRLKWGMRMEGFWTLEALFNAEKTRDGESSERSARLSDVAHWTRTAAEEDLKRRKPSLVLVERCADPTISCGTSVSLREVDILQWFRADPIFTAYWADYQRCGQVGYYDVWYLKQDGNVCHAVASIPSYVNSLQASRPLP